MTDSNVRLHAAQSLCLTNQTTPSETSEHSISIALLYFDPLPTNQPNLFQHNNFKFGMSPLSIYSNHIPTSRHVVVTVVSSRGRCYTDGDLTESRIYGNSAGEDRRTSRRTHRRSVLCAKSSSTRESNRSLRLLISLSDGQLCSTGDKVIEKCAIGCCIRIHIM